MKHCSTERNGSIKMTFFKFFFFLFSRQIELSEGCGSVPETHTLFLPTDKNESWRSTETTVLPWKSNKERQVSIKK